MIKLYLAPLQGYTEIEFRRAWSGMFTGLDVAVSPFIPLAENFRFRSAHLHDVIPGQNTRMAVIPQVLGTDPVKFIFLADRLKELGYQTINWNLGCPKKGVAQKKRGSGLLPYPDQLREILEKLIPKLPVSLSIKTRLGYNSTEEFFKLIEVYNDFPLDSLMVHPRIGTQMYEGGLHLDVLDQTINEIRHKVVFSGDISDLETYKKLKTRFPRIDDWMLGRGVLTNPYLPELLKTGKIEADEEKIRRTLGQLHQELYCEMKGKTNHKNAILNKMKGFWSYFSRWFENDEAIFGTLARTNNVEDFMEYLKKAFNEYPLSKTEGRSSRQIKLNSQGLDRQ
jgi:tRNA-dihydrouridine synthase